MPPRRLAAALLVFPLIASGVASAQSAGLAGVVRDESGRPLAGVVVELRTVGEAPFITTTDAQGRYRFDGVPTGDAQLTFALPGFAPGLRQAAIPASGDVRADAALHLAFNADVTVSGKSTFTNLADAANPARNLVGIAQAASQGAITARQIDARPLMRAGEVLETVPGVVISQHSGEGKANQYYLRGFNLDHGTDFATTVAGMPVNMPTHGHGHGYSDLNFLIPELVTGVQFSKGPYYAEQGDFATAGAANINYANVLPGPLARVSGGGHRFGRALVAASPAWGPGHLVAALDVQHNDGPWESPNNHRKLSGLLRYSRGDAFNGVALTAMGYYGRWNSTDQIPARAVAGGIVGRFGDLDRSDGGDTYRYSASAEWHRTRGNAATKVAAFGIAYDLNLFSNFTYFLGDPINGDQFQQVDRRLVTGARLTHRRLGRWLGRATDTQVGVQVRNDDIGALGLFNTAFRRRLDTVREDSVLQTSAAAFAQQETQWRPWLRTLAGLRVDGYRFGVDAGDPRNGGTAYAGLVSPKGGAIIGPFQGTEFYVNAGLGFHSNDARGVTIRADPATGGPADRVTPLARARGAEVGVRTVRVPHLQSSLSVWTLSLASELIFVGDAGTTEPGRPSRRHGIEWANYYSPRPWLIVDADVSISRGEFTDDDPAGTRIPGSVETVLSGGVTVDHVGNFFGSARWRYFGPRPLVENDSVRSAATSLLNLTAGYRISRRARLALDVFNLLDARHSDVDYYYASRLPGEPADGIDDIHFHPTLPRTARVNLTVGF
jgi:TonB dependent receptor/TonB-dependent Receptor Plug Domain/Carboxypeptidase regulatory-like domain